MTDLNVSSRDLKSACEQTLRVDGGFHEHVVIAVHHKRRFTADLAALLGAHLHSRVAVDDHQLNVLGHESNVPSLPDA